MSDDVNHRLRVVEESNADLSKYADTLERDLAWAKFVLGAARIKCGHADIRLRVIADRGRRIKELQAECDRLAGRAQRAEMGIATSMGYSHGEWSGVPASDDPLAGLVISRNGVKAGMIWRGETGFWSADEALRELLPGFIGEYSGRGEAWDELCVEVGRTAAGFMTGEGTTRKSCDLPDFKVGGSAWSAPAVKWGADGRANQYFIQCGDGRTLGMIYEGRDGLYRVKGFDGLPDDHTFGSATLAWNAVESAVRHVPVREEG